MGHTATLGHLLFKKLNFLPKNIVTRTQHAPEGVLQP